MDKASSFKGPGLKLSSLTGLYLDFAQDFIPNGERLGMRPGWSILRAVSALLSQKNHFKVSREVYWTIAGDIKKQISQKCSPKIFTSFKFSSELSIKSLLVIYCCCNSKTLPRNTIKCIVLLLEYIASQGWISVSSDLSTLSCTVSC